MAFIESSYHYSLAHDYLQAGVRTPRPNLMGVLENRGCGTTSPRKAIAELLEEKHEGVTAEAPGEELSPVGRATAYRTSKLFLEAGLICGILMMDGARVYSLTGAGHRHHHSVCVPVRCGGRVQCGSHRSAAQGYWRRDCGTDSRPRRCAVRDLRRLSRR